MTYVGIDFSMTSPAVCVYSGDPNKFSFTKSNHHSLSSHKIKSSKNIICNIPLPFENQMQRFDNLSKWVMSIIGTFSDLTVGLEDYAMGAKGKVFHIGECGGILKHALWQAGIRFETYPPTVIKKFYTGKGNAKKQDMHDRFIEENGIDLKAQLQPKRLLGSPTTDIVDAFAICAYTIKNNS